MTIQEKLDRRKALGNFREQKVVHGLIDFSSNDHLGLARSQLLHERINEEISMHTYSRYGSTGSRLLTGNSSYIEDLENAIAAFHGYEAGLIFNCGYMANLGLLSTILDATDIVLFDSDIHASTHDGIRLSHAKSFAFRHNDLNHLEKRLFNLASQGNCCICVESIYSMDGSQAPLEDICKLAKKYNAKVIVDEAHAVGVSGPEGRGLVAEKQLSSEVYAQIVTFGKGLGTHGAIVLGNETLKHALINFCNAYIYTTALPFHCLAAIKCAYLLLPFLTDERRQINKLKKIITDTGLASSETHIQPILVKGNKRTKDLSNKLAIAGFDVRAILSPTVRRGNEILRINLHAFNHEDELRNLFNTIQKI